jgi:hypothetical protein
MVALPVPRRLVVFIPGARMIAGRVAQRSPVVHADLIGAHTTNPAALEHPVQLTTCDRAIHGPRSRWSTATGIRVAECRVSMERPRSRR